MRNKKNTFLLTGATGFLGSNILRRLVVGGNKVIVLKRSSSSLSRINGLLEELILYDLDMVKLEEIFSEHKIDKIIHCATNYGRHFTAPLEIIEANLLLPLKLLELSEKYCVDCFINTDTILNKRVNYYTLSKAQFKQWLEIYSLKINCINVELEHFFGPDDDESKFVTFIIHELLRGVSKIDLTEGAQKRSFIYIEDVVEAFMKIIEYSDSLKSGFANFQVGSTETLEIKRFVELAKEVVGNRETVLNFGALPYRENEVMKVELDISSLEKIGWQPKVSLREGLVRTVEVERRVLRK